MPVIGSRSTLTTGARPPQHEEPKAKEADARSGLPLGAPTVEDKSVGDHFFRPQMPVNDNDAALNTDKSGVVVNQAADPKPTLSADEVLAAPVERRGELVRRFSAFLSLLAGGKVGPTAVDAPPSGALARDGAKAQIEPHEITLSIGGEQVTVPLDRRLRRTEAAELTPVALRAVERLLFQAGGVDEDAARLHLFLLGPDGLLTRGPNKALDESERFANPKLLCWDFNGTVEKFGDGRTRGDMARSSRTMQRRGATSLITTTIRPEKPEDFMVENQVAFGGYYGKNEVRPTKGNKQYQGIAAAHGISPDEAPARMAILGDSATDIPSDLPGTVFFHNSAMTPAPAVELLLKELDSLGKGDLSRGLAALCGGLPPPGEVKAARVGDAALKIEMRNSGTEQAPVMIPTIFDVELTLSAPEMVKGLRTPPPSTDLDARARYQLLLEHLADGLDETQVAGVLTALSGAQGHKPAAAAVKRRLEQRAKEVEAGREATQKLPSVLASPMPFDKLLQHVAELTVLGDSEVAAALPGQVALAGPIADATEADVVAALEAHAADVRARAEALLPKALPFFPASGKPDPAVDKLARIAKGPVPTGAKAQEKALQTLDELADKPAPGTREPLEAILDGLDEALAEQKKAVHEAFAERRQRAGELSALASHAGRIAKVREATFADIEAAVGAA